MGKASLALAVDKENVLSHDTETTLEHVVNIMPQLVHWLIKSGVGYSEFTTALKALFYNEAIKELENIKQKNRFSY